MLSPALSALAFAAASLAGSIALAVPQFVSYSGRLSDGTAWGQSLPGVTLTFALYDAETGGTRLWEQTFADVVVVDGAFSVVLGEGMSASGVALPVTDVFAEREAVWVAVSVAPPDGDGADLAPRQQIGSVPYAARADRAERVEARVDAKRYSSNALYRGSTYGVAGLAGQGSFNADGQTQGRIELPGIAAGYASAKAACELALGSSSAHMCSAEEVVRSVQLGLSASLTNRWYSTGATDRSALEDGSGRVWHVEDCIAWTVGVLECVPGSNPAVFCGGPVWAGVASHDNCDRHRAIACCD